MKIAISGFHLESASTLTQVSDVDAFEERAIRGPQVIDAFRGTNTVPGGFVAACEEAGAEITCGIYTYLGALGPASDEAVSTYANEIAAHLRAEMPDGVLLHLHGATWAHGYPDVERHFLELARAAVGPDVPIVVCLDYHGNIDADTIACADGGFAYRHSPHIDMGETGERGAAWLFSMLADGHRPGVAVAKPGLLVPSIFSATSLSPLAEIIAGARQREAESTEPLDISILAGFSYADSHNTGFSVIVVADAGQATAQRIATEIAEEIHAARAKIYRPLPVYDVPTSVTEALAIARYAEKPVVLLEHADRLNDSTYLLAEITARGAPRVAIPFLWDTDAAKAAHAAGVGARISLPIGAWSSPQAGPRQTYVCEVLQTGRKTYHISGQMLNGQHVDLGMTALLRIGGVDVSVVSNFAFTVDEDVFRVFGQNIGDYDIIVLRSKTHFRQYYEKAAEEILIVDTPDHGPADLTHITYRNLDVSRVYPFTGE
jgi:microcystin degradation protein MlrC